MSPAVDLLDGSGYCPLLHPHPHPLGYPLVLHPTAPPDRHPPRPHPPSCATPSHLPSCSLSPPPALTLHESAPGHSFQGSLVEEQKSVPDFRHEYISAYGEGWALYCEKLGKEMGIYQTPYDEFGRESYEMWRAVRLVIDTGMHHKGWTRAQAIKYLADHTALSQHEVETEVDRYISWPGQALSYKLGELKILELRALAEKELGTKFDIRKFHDSVLEIGSVPLPVLEQPIATFIAEQKAKT